MTNTIYISDRAIGVSAKNSKFPKLSDIVAARMLFAQDVDPDAPHYVKSVSFARVPVVGRCPMVQS
jgi:hypothetical protein